MPVAALENVALGKPATSNGVYADQVADRAVDGDPLTAWTAPDHGSPGDPNRLQVDLGGLHAVDRIRLFFVNSGIYEGYTNVYQLFGSPDGVDWSPLGSGTLVDSPDPNLRTHTLVLTGAARNLRFLRCDIVGGSHWSQMHELEAYGSPFEIHPLASEWVDGMNPMPGAGWSVLAGDFPLLPVASLASTGIDTWTGEQAGFTASGLPPIEDVIPVWFKASRPFTGIGSPVDWLDGDVVCHSGRDSDPVTNVRWTSPGDGFATLAGAVWPVREVGRTNLWRLSRNGTVLSEGTVGHGDAYSRAHPFRFEDGSGGAAALSEIPVQKGDALAFSLQPAPGSIPDYSAANLTVTFAPSPPENEYDFERDFTAGANDPQAVWSYRSGAARNGSYMPMPYFYHTGWESLGLAHHPSWHASADDESLPHVGCNVYPFSLSTSTGATFAPGESFLHPGAGGELTVVTFRAPRAGTLLVDCAFTDVDPGSGDGVSWWVDHGDGTALAAGTLPNGGSSGLLRLAPFFVNQGDLLHFLVGAGGTPDHDATRLRAEIRLVPADAPSTTVAFDGSYVDHSLLDSNGRIWKGEGDFSVVGEPSKWGGAGCFDGNFDALTPADDSADFTPGNEPFTVDFWIHPVRDGRADYLVGKSQPDAGQGWDLRLDYGEILVTGVNGWQINIGTDQIDDVRYIEANRWHHVALSCTETRAYLFVDGRLRGESARGNIGAAPNPFRLGWQDHFGGRGFQGYLDEFRYWRLAVWEANFIPPAYPGMGDAVLAASLPIPGFEATSDQMTLRWQTRKGLEYGVERSIDLADWKIQRPYAPALVPEDSETIAIRPGTAPRVFFRVGTRLGTP